MRTSVLLVSFPSSLACPTPLPDNLPHLNIKLSYSLNIRGAKPALFTWLRISQLCQSAGIWDLSGRKHWADDWVVLCGCSLLRSTTSQSVFFSEQKAISSPLLEVRQLSLNRKVLWNQSAQAGVFCVLFCFCFKHRHFYSSPTIKIIEKYSREE